MSKDGSPSRDIYAGLQPYQREKLAWLIITSQTDSQIFPPEVVLGEVERYLANPIAYTYDDPLFLLPYMEQIFGRPSVEQRRN